MRKIVFALLLSLCIGIAPVFACSIPTPNADGSNIWTMEDYVRTSQAILVGTVVRADEELPNDIVYSGNIELAYYLKGDGPENVSFDVSPVMAACSSSIYLRDNLIFFGFWTAEHSFQLMWVENLDAEAEIVDMLNPSSAPSPNADDRVIGASLLVLAASSFIVFWYFRRNARKLKAKREELL